MNPTVLVVEEDRGGRALLARWLEQAGYHVREAGNSGEARRRIAARSPDIVVIEAGSGYRAGMELVASLFSDLTLPAVRTLVLTRDGAVAAYAEDLGAEFLPHPVLREDLLAAVSRLLGAPAPAGPPIGYESAVPQSASWPLRA
jgi:DNA-binding response OmpR family regulator